ncbi:MULTISPECIES: hypothetical protein [Leuconostoc]|uniref:hypothetical protein n=1 Tax=Leuconostoc TaxID=1243 RepID=UPI0032DE86B6
MVSKNAEKLLKSILNDEFLIPEALEGKIAPNSLPEGVIYRQSPLNGEQETTVAIYSLQEARLLKEFANSYFVTRKGYIYFDEQKAKNAYALKYGLFFPMLTGAFAGLFSHPVLSVIVKLISSRLK